jgi:hypothetical protein
MASAHFSVSLDLPPAPPEGLVAVPGDGEVALSWAAHAEPDVVGYRVYRSPTSGGPYAPIADVVAPSHEDAGLANGVTVYYVVTALDARFESGTSSEVAATPTGSTTLPAEVRLWPDEVAAGCLRHGHGHPDGADVKDSVGRIEKRLGRLGLEHDLSGGQQGAAEPNCGGGGCGDGCPRFVYVTIELPAGQDPRQIDPASVRLGGSVGPYPGRDQIADTDRDGIPERKLRFRFDRVAPLLTVGLNELRVTGSAGSLPFEGVGSLTVGPVHPWLHVLPRVLWRFNRCQDLVAWIQLHGPFRAEDVDVDTIRLNGTVSVDRVVWRFRRHLVVTFDRAAVDAVLPTGHHVEVRVTGVVDGLPFEAKDDIRVVR